MKYSFGNEMFNTLPNFKRGIKLDERARPQCSRRETFLNTLTNSFITNANETLDI